MIKGESRHERNHESLTDKCVLMRQAESLDIPIPRTWHADGRDTFQARLEDLPYPLVLKPGKSWLRVQGKWHRYGVQFAETPLEAQQLIDANPAFQAHPFLLQACVSGEGAGIFALYDRGRPLAFFAHRRLREKPPRGGVSTLSESVGFTKLPQREHSQAQSQGAEAADTCFILWYQ